jgi:hypothetical protein
MGIPVVARGIRDQTNRRVRFEPTFETPHRWVAALPEADALLEALTYPAVCVCDTWLFGPWNMEASSLDDVLAAVRQLEAIARRAEALRDTIAAWRARVADALAQASCGEAIVEWREIRASGKRAGVRLEIVASMGSATTRVTAHLASPCGIALHVVPQLHGVRGVFAQDIKVGDEAFDAWFTIQGKDGDAVRARLGKEARARLLAIANASTRVEVLDDRVELRIDFVVDDADHFVALAEDLVAAAAAIAPPLAETPYR